ncbi:MAG: CvpA family protein [Micavibrio aeruginosavorus]|uniref:CvpA family protein n=1 Tax=Micavibrio aeruginosavorus TaxID=349221 RepID=A0A7T5UH70_9BACT|nr:MAG: CvpA family protein [Micavibrio aeruginosavorus]
MLVIMIVDAVVLGVLLVSAVFAFLRGFIREVLTILGVVGGLAASVAFGAQLRPLMNQWLGVDKNAADPQMLAGVVPYTVVAEVLAYGAIFLIVVIVLSLVSHLLAGWARTLGLGAIDRTLGVVFGIARGILVLAVIYLLPYLLFKDDARQQWPWLKESRTIVYIEATSKWLADFLPESMRNTDPASLAESATSVTKATRDKLKDLELLKDENVGDKDVSTPEEEGYDPALRQDMQELMLEQSGDIPPPMPESSPQTDGTAQPAIKTNE